MKANLTQKHFNKCKKFYKADINKQTNKQTANLTVWMTNENGNSKTIITKNRCFKVTYTE